MPSNSNSANKPTVNVTQDEFDEMIARVFEELEHGTLNQAFMFNDSARKRYFLFTLSEQIVDRVMDELLCGHVTFENELDEHSRKREIINKILTE